MSRGLGKRPRLAVEADDISPALHHHLRRIDAVQAEPRGIVPLPLGCRIEGEQIAPA